MACRRCGKALGLVLRLKRVLTPFNWLTEARDGGDALIASYAYDPFGRRIKKTTSAGTTWFIYSDEGLIAEVDAGGTITRQYGWQSDGTWGTAPLYLSTGDKTYYYQNDHLGTPQKLITASGAVVWSAEFEAFGKAHTLINSVENPLRFPGQYYDAETGRYYNYFRDYDPGIGRYVQSDPIGLKGGINNYAYVGGNPLKYVDPLGLRCASTDCLLYSGNEPSNWNWPSTDELNETTKEEVIYAAKTVASICGGAAFVFPKLFGKLVWVPVTTSVIIWVDDPTKENAVEIGKSVAPSTIGKVSPTLGEGVGATIIIHDLGVSAK